MPLAHTMRALPLVLAVLLLAGCAAPGQENEEDDPLFGLCPQWVEGAGATTGTVELGEAKEAKRELGPANATYLERPLDLFRIKVTAVDVDGRLQLRATAADGQRLSLRDYRIGEPQMVPVANIDASAMDQEFDVFLSPVTHDAPTADLPASLEWRLDGAHARVDYEVTYHYKVCGA